MSFDSDAAFLAEYERWKGERKVSTVDDTPETFLVERARAEAYSQLTKIIGAVEETERLLVDDELPDPTVQDLIKNIRDILEGII